jgi:hypothetical protein
MSDAKLGLGPRGERGERGHRGKTGPTGPAGGGGGESTTQILNGSITPPATFGFLNDYAPVGGHAAARWRLQSTGSSSQLRGILLDGGGGNVDGFTLYISNIGSSEPIIFENESSSSAPANRILTPNGSPATLDPGAGAILQYDGTSLRWRILGIATTTLPSTVVQGDLSQSGGFATLDRTFLTSSVSFTGVSSAVNASGTINNFSDANAPGFSTSHQLQVSTAGVTITGFVPPQAGAEIVIENLQVSTGNITIDNDSGSSAVGNRVITPSGSPLVIAPNHTVTLLYELSQGHWYVVAMT